jgi:hypothetical protein
MYLLKRKKIEKKSNVQTHTHLDQIYVPGLVELVMRQSLSIELQIVTQIERLQMQRPAPHHGKSYFTGS